MKKLVLTLVLFWVCAVAVKVVFFESSSGSSDPGNSVDHNSVGYQTGQRMSSFIGSQDAGICEKAFSVYLENDGTTDQHDDFMAGCEGG